MTSRLEWDHWSTSWRTSFSRRRLSAYTDCRRAPLRCSGSRIRLFGTPLMITRDRITRLLAICCWVGLAITAPHFSYAQLLTAPQAQESDGTTGSPGRPLSDNYQWDTNVVAAAAAPTSGSNASPALTMPAGNDEAATLAKRVEALENTIQQMKTPETLPAPAKKEAKEKANDAKDGECIPKLIDPITKPTFQPLGRITFDGVAYDDDDDAMAFFHTDRADELGFRSVRIGGKGNIYENLIYNFEVELRGTNSAVSYKDIY